MPVACVELPAFPLQLIWRSEPAMRAVPLAIVDQDRPQGEVRWACTRARTAGVQVGHRYAYALSLCRELRARVMPEAALAEATGELRTVLHTLSPGVEPGAPGTFWLDGDGLAKLYVDGTAWGQAIDRALQRIGYRATIVVGFSRYAAYAIARAAGLGVLVMRSEDSERNLASQAPLAKIDLPTRLRHDLSQLGVTRLGGLTQLDGLGVGERFGRGAGALHAVASGRRWDPVVAAAPPEAPDERVLFDDDEHDVERLVFAAKPPIERLLARLASRHRAVTALHVELTLKHAVGHVSLRTDVIKPAAPTLDGRALLRLFHLRLTGAPPQAPINAVRVWADDQPATREQLALFAQKPRRDLRAADEAIAGLRAELGDGAVVHAVLRDGQLPEARFSWEPLARVVAASPPAQRRRQLIRRMFARPRQLPMQYRSRRDDGWLLSGVAHGAVVRIRGPYIVSGGWWTREISRDYHFADLKRGERLWVYYDRHRRRWFWHGAVE